MFAIWMCVKAAESYDNSSFLVNLIDDLTLKYNRIGNKRYYENSQNHLTKLRILQFLNLIFDYIDFDQLFLLFDWCFEKLINEPNQVNVKILMQWFLSKILKKIGSNEMLERLLSSAKELGNSVAAIFPLIYTLLKHHQCPPYDAIKVLTTFSVGPNFKVRYAAQVRKIKKL